MLFSPRLSSRHLAVACRALATLLHSGVPIQRAVQVAADKVGDARCRESLGNVAEAVSRGETVADALQAEKDRFPELMREMVRTGEESGALPEILKNLAEHYENNVRLRRSFYSAIAWPLVQFTLAVLVIALLIYILGWIADSRGTQALDVLGFGLSGAEGAIVWLAMVGGTLLSLWAAYQLIAHNVRGKRALHGFAMKIPVVGNCMRAFAIARFSWAFYLTQQTGMPVDHSVRASLRATNNGAFINSGDIICRRINKGDALADALRAGGVFPADYLSMVEVAETSGTVPETLHRLSPQFEEDARRSLSALTTALGWLIWMLVAGFIIFLIFRIALWYVGMIKSAAGGIR